jgi:hypothetical protein
MKQQKEEMQHLQTNHNCYTWTSSQFLKTHRLHHELPVQLHQL